MNDKIKDVIMIGAGPSALTAAVYTTREDIDTVLYEKATVGGAMAITDKIDNYPGFPDGVEGFEISEKFQEQAKRFGAKIEFGDVTAIRHEGDIQVATIDGNEVKAKVILIAAGAGYSKLGVPGEAEYYGRGVHYCATCDGAFYRGKDIIVVGGGNSAIQEAMYLTRFAAHIDLLVRGKISATEVLQRDLQKLVDEGKVTVHLQTSINKINAIDDRVASVSAIKDGKVIEMKTNGVFVFVGLSPNTGFLEGSGIELDEMGFVKTDNELRTNIPGIFASGDVRSGATMQVASAVGEGATAAISIREYLQDHK
jgi:thioredoxin reductase (NADPH)